MFVFFQKIQNAQKYIFFYDRKGCRRVQENHCESRNHNGGNYFVLLLRFQKLLV